MAVTAFLPEDAPAPSASETFPTASICHCSALLRALGGRVVFMQSVPLVKYGFRPLLVAPHGREGEMSRVRLIPTPPRSNRALRILSAPFLLSRVLRQEADLYQIHDPELLPVGLLLKLVFRKKVVYDSCEDYPLMILTRTWIPQCLRMLLRRWVCVLEQLATRCLDGVVTADSATLRRLAKTGQSKKLVFYNFPNLECFPEPARGPKPFDVVYRGGLSERAGTEVLLGALRLLADQGRTVRLLLIGYFDNPRAEALLRHRIQNLGLESTIELRGWVEHQEMAKILQLAQIGVCPLRPIPKFLHNIPVKVWEYWACGLPVVASDLPPIRPFFSQGKCGFRVKPDDPVALAAAIRWLLEHPAEAAQMGAAGRRIVTERLNNGREIPKLVRFYRRILEQP